MARLPRAITLLLLTVPLLGTCGCGGSHATEKHPNPTVSAKALATAMQARLEAAGYTVYTGSGAVIGVRPQPQPVAHLRVPIEFATTRSWTFTVAVFASPGAAAQARRVSLRLVRTYCNLRHEPLASCAARPQGRQRLVGQIEYDAFRDVTGQAPPPLVQFNRLLAIASGR